jgi:hypothetical protein
MSTEKSRRDDPGICIWCSCLFQGSPVCNRCTEVWAKICDDPTVAAERETLFTLAPIYEKLDPTNVAIRASRCTQNLRQFEVV